MIEEMKNEVLVANVKEIMGKGNTGDIRDNLIILFGPEKGERAYKSLLAGNWE